tara:strand:+ start:11161 stop:13356 length:2196 start_codon:yes stop_codon:yes gene_type:complete
MMAVGIIMATLIFMATKSEKKTYATETLINTGLVTGYSLESSKGGKTDREYTGKEMQNIINVFNAYETQEEVCTKLLAKILMLEEADPRIILQHNLDLLYQFDFSRELRDKLIRETEESTYENLVVFRDSTLSNEVADLIASKHDFFSLSHLSGVSIAVQGNSDILKLEYATTDPGICVQTLLVLVEVATARHKVIKNSQTGSVVEYFELETQKAYAGLEDDEAELLAFRKENNIINYYEQTRYISARKEDLNTVIREEQMNSAAADSALKRLEHQLDKGSTISAVNNRIAKSRDELSSITAQIARNEIASPDQKPRNEKLIVGLKKQAKAIKKEIKQAAEKEFELKHSVNGIAVGDLLTEWLENSIIIEETKARLSVAKQIALDFDEVYRSFAPLGSIIKRIERQIDVSERAYLETLHSLNQAKLHEKSMSMSANLKVLDKPFYPTKPAASKRKVLIAVGFIAGIMIVLIVIIVMEFLDSTLKTPKNTIEQTQLKLFSAFPRIPVKKSHLKKINYKFLVGRCTDNLLQNIKLELRSLNVTRKCKQIVVLSSRLVEGKTTVASTSISALRKYGEKVLYLSPSNGGSQKIIAEFNSLDNHPDNLLYDVDHELFKKKNIGDLLNNPDFRTDYYDYIFIEIPALLHAHYPVDLVANSDISLLVCRANRVWDEADTKALEAFKKGVDYEPFVILNGAKADLLESIVGEIPKNRSWLRRHLKKIIVLGFKAKRSIR